MEQGMNPIEQIKKLHNEIETTFRKSLDTAIRIGELLNAQKKELGHSNWQEWVVKNLPFKIRTATNYMKLHRKREELKTANVADLSAAYKWLYSDKPQARPKRKPKKSAGLPKGRQVMLGFTNTESREFKKLVDKLAEVFETADTKEIVLAAIRHTYKDKVDENYTPTNGSATEPSSGNGRVIPGRQTLRPANHGRVGKGVQAERATAAAVSSKGSAA